MAQIGATIAKAIRSARVSRIDVIPENTQVNVETVYELLGGFEPLIVYMLGVVELVCLELDELGNHANLCTDVVACFFVLSLLLLGLLNHMRVVVDPAIHYVSHFLLLRWGRSPVG